MGNIFANVLKGLFGQKENAHSHGGPGCCQEDNILRKPKLGEIVTTIPTIGFNVETVEYKNVIFTVWDVVDQDKIQPLCCHYFSTPKA
ncbi:hypothetical protein U0070_020359 [Myodes glareolus]|uniref:Uncharacterized protein n=1 Tax=Myodes glareolus TaxID=447135 RepID=A0AAW0H915_MYOGA